jgi:hypothetical protein
MDSKRNEFLSSLSREPGEVRTRALSNTILHVLDALHDPFSGRCLGALTDVETHQARA